MPEMYSRDQVARESDEPGSLAEESDAERLSDNIDEDSGSSTDMY